MQTEAFHSLEAPPTLKTLPSHQEKEREVSLENNKDEKGGSPPSYRVLHFLHLLLILSILSLFVFVHDQDTGPDQIQWSSHPPFPLC